MTYLELVDEVMERSYPEGVAPNLDVTYRKRVLDGLIELQRWIPYLKNRHFNIIPFGATLYRQGCSIINTPPGKVKRVASFVRNNLKDIVYYDACTRNDIDRLLAEQSRLKIYPTAAPTQIGYFNASPVTDKGFRVERGLFCIDQKQLWVLPNLESIEWLMVEWQGAKTSFLPTDVLDFTPFDPQVLDALSLYLKKETGLREDRNTSDYVPLRDRWKEALGGLKIDAQDILSPEYVDEDVGELMRGSIPIETVALDFLDLVDDFIDPVSGSIRRLEIYKGEFRIVNSPLTTGLDWIWMRDADDQTVYKFRVSGGSDVLDSGDPGTEQVYDSVPLKDKYDATVYDLIVKAGIVTLRLNTDPAQPAGSTNGTGSCYYQPTLTPPPCVQQVFTYAGNPNGQIPELASKFTTLPLFCIDTLNDVIWRKVDSVASNTGWIT